MADPSKDLRDAASPARVLLSQSRQLAEQLQVRSAKLYRLPHELRRWHDGLHQSVAIWALPGCGGLTIITLTGPEGLGNPEDRTASRPRPRSSASTRLGTCRLSSSTPSTARRSTPSSP